MYKIGQKIILLVMAITIQASPAGPFFVGIGAVVDCRRLWDVPPGWRPPTARRKAKRQSRLLNSTICLFEFDRSRTFEAPLRSNCPFQARHRESRDRPLPFGHAHPGAARPTIEDGWPAAQISTKGRFSRCFFPALCGNEFWPAPGF